MKPDHVFEPKSHYDFDELLACGRGELFGPGNAQLPLPPMLMFDRISRIDSNGGQFDKGLIEAELDIRPDLWFFDCHFTGDPVMPGCLGLDAMWQMLGFFLAWSGGPGHGRALAAGDVQFTGQVTQEARVVRYRLDGQAHNIAQTCDGDRGWGHAGRRTRNLHGNGPEGRAVSIDRGILSEPATTRSRI